MASAARPQPEPIQLRLHTIGQLYQTLDPLPFRERDLDAGVEEYVVGWAGEMAHAHPISILIHLPPAEVGRDDVEHIPDAVRNYFAHRAEAAGWDLRDLFRNGRVSAAIGVAVLAACILIGRSGGNLLGDGYLRRFFDEGLIILGWVANWRPIQIFLYDWWPIISRRRLYRRLAAAQVKVVAGA
jgi:hypothetical protein